MTNRLQVGIVVLMAQGLVGCGPEASVQMPSPSSPSSFVPYVTVQPTPEVFNPTRILSGFVFEIAEGVEVPIEGVRVYCEPCTEETHSSAYTDNRGFYSFTGVWGTAFSIWASKEGYGDPPGSRPNSGFPSGPGWRDVTINGDTRFNVQLARK